MSYQSEYSGAQVEEAVGKALNPDATPTQNSTNLVESGGVYDSLAPLRSVDAVPTQNSTNLVQSGGVASAVSTVGNAVSRRNLLDNWYFVGGGSQQGGGQFPINQRGNTSYSGGGGGYFIDRWKRINSINCSLQSDCLQITNTNWGLRQVVGMPPGTYTFSMLARKLTYPSGGSMGFGTYNAIGSDWEILGNDWGLYTETYVATSDLTNANLQFNANVGSYSIEILAMKLELGSTQTLAHKENGAWVLNDIPNFAEELLKCQRYFVRISGYYTAHQTASAAVPYDVSIPFPVQMRAVPTISNATYVGSSQASGYDASYSGMLRFYSTSGGFVVESFNASADL